MLLVASYSSIGASHTLMASLGCGCEYAAKYATLLGVQLFRKAQIINYWCMLTQCGIYAATAH